MNETCACGGHLIPILDVLECNKCHAQYVSDEPESKLIIRTKKRPQFEHEYDRIAHMRFFTHDALATRLTKANDGNVYVMDKNIEVTFFFDGFIEIRQF